MSQALYLQISSLGTTRQLFTIIDKQMPAMMFVFCNTTTYLVGATMDFDVHLLNCFNFIILPVQNISNLQIR